MLVPVNDEGKLESYFSESHNVTHSTLQVLACDGLWDVYSNHKVCSIGLRSLLGSPFKNQQGEFLRISENV
jgi:hypothetical protein